MWWGCPMYLVEECGLDPREKRPEAAVDELLFPSSSLVLQRG